jgi:hypothetical protein
MQAEFFGDGFRENKKFVKGGAPPAYSATENIRQKEIGGG